MCGITPKLSHLAEVSKFSQDSQVRMLILSLPCLSVTDTRKWKQKKTAVVPGLSAWFICFQHKKPADQAVYPE